MFNADKSTILSGGDRAGVRQRVGLAAEVFDRYGDEIRAIIHFNVKDKSTTDDIFQEFFVSIVRRPIPTDINDIRAYLYRVVTNDVIDTSRHTKNCQGHIERYVERRQYRVVQEDPQDIVIQAEEAERMFRLIESRLPEREAEVVVQRLGNGLSTTDTAERMQLDKKSVSRYLSMAMKKMRRLIPGNGDDIQ
jgi:RNA polymerase sigma-70 factor (ECF subfamily)